MCAMGGVRLYNMDGSPVDEACDYYIRRAEGGVGLIVTRALVVLPVGQKVKLYDHPEIFAPLKKLTDGVHQYGCKVFLQLSGGAGRTVHKRVEELEALGYKKDEAFFAPSDDIPNVWYPEIKHRGLTKDEIHEYIHAFGKMAKIAQDMGFDGVEIHAIHEGYLLDQFTTACTNHRTDEYGGSLENRFRMVCEIIENIKQTCGNRYPVAVRYSVTSKMKGFNDGALPNESYTEFGRNIEEGIKGAQLMEKAGADMLDCDNGSYDAWYWAHPPVYMPNCCNLEESAVLKKHVSIPVVCAGKMDIPEDAVSALNAGQCDAIGIARALLVDPDYVKKIENGEAEAIKPCIGCHSGCLAQVAAGKKPSCALNPTVMNEKKYASLKPKHRQSVAVIGAGVAGIETALLLRQYGFPVHIYEKGSVIGGNFRRAAQFSHKDRDRLLLKWYENELKKAEIPVHFHTNVNAETLDSLKEDMIVMAPGVREKPLIYANQYADTIRVEVYLEDHSSIHQNVLMIGGGLTAIEAALDMDQEGRNVIIVEMRDAILDSPSLCDANRIYLKQALKASSIRIMTSSKIVSLQPDLIEVETNGERKAIPFSYYTIVEATGYMCDPDILDCVNDHRVHVIGDARKIGNVYTAVKDAYDLTAELCSM